ncbi:MAG TPA: SRPBCC family protein [Dehalococcoidia bacterium]
MAHVEKSVEVQAPIADVFRTWTSFEDYPQFMEGVRQVRKVGPSRTHWVMDAGGTRHEWDARITDTTTNRRIAWTNETGEQSDSEIVLEPTAPDRTRVYFAMDYEPQDRTKSPAEQLGFVERRTESDLQRFKQYVESHGPTQSTPDRMEAQMRSRDYDYDDRMRQGMEQGKQQVTHMLTMPRLNPLEWASASLLTIGGINWGLEGIFDFDLVDEVFDEDSIVAKVIYGSIAAAAVYTLFGLVRADVMSRRKESEHHAQDQMRMEPEMYERRSSLV